jgi:hypothetical protein
MKTLEMGKRNIDTPLGNWLERLNFQQQINDGFFKAENLLGLFKQEVDASIFPVAIVRKAKMEGLTPKEYVARMIRKAIINKDSSIRQEDHFFVVGYDTLESDFYFCNSADSLDFAREVVREFERIDEDFDDPGNRYEIFNRDGVPVSA